MYKIGEKIKYRQEVCTIVNIRENPFSHLECYVLAPIDDESLKVEVPVTADDMLRPLISEAELREIIQKIPTVDLITVSDNQLENEYKNLLKSGDHLDLVKVIKTAYLRNQKRMEHKKKIGEKDHTYLLKAEKSLYDEFSVILNMSYEDTKAYIEQEVAKLK